MSGCVSSSDHDGVWLEAHERESNHSSNADTVDPMMLILMDSRELMKEGKNLLSLT